MIKKMIIDESTNIVDFKETKNNNMVNSVLKDFLEKEGISQAELANQGAALEQQIGVARLNNELATIKILLMLTLTNERNN